MSWIAGNDIMNIEIGGSLQGVVFTLIAVHSVRLVGMEEAGCTATFSHSADCVVQTCFTAFLIQQTLWSKSWQRTNENHTCQSVGMWTFEILFFWTWRNHSSKPLPSTARILSYCRTKVKLLPITSSLPGTFPFIYMSFHFSFHRFIHSAWLNKHGNHRPEPNSVEIWHTRYMGQHTSWINWLVTPTSCVQM